jgi:hypothetical protein
MTRIGFKVLTLLSVPYIRLPMSGSYVCHETEARLGMGGLFHTTKAWRQRFLRRQHGMHDCQENALLIAI